MALTITRKVQSPPAIFFTQGFVTTLEAHIAYFKQSASTQVVQLDPVRVQAHLGDFYGMLSEIRIGFEYHWFIARLNDMHSPSDFDGSTMSIFVPDTKEIDKIRMNYNVIGNITV
jgi:predicted nucleotide-binding protein